MSFIIFPARPILAHLIFFPNLVPCILSIYPDTNTRDAQQKRALDVESSLMNEINTKGVSTTSSSGVSAGGV